jgi:4-amino-4-deoxychorismate lyase
MTTIIHHDKSQTPVPVNDRSFNYGDGCFTTILSQNNTIQLIDRHIDRLQKATSILGFEPVDWQQLKNTLQTMATDYPSVIKVLISRGAGGRGYSPANLEPFIYITVADYPKYYDRLRKEGLRLGISSIQLGSNPLLAGIKHCNRLEQVLIKKSMENQAFEEVVVCDLAGCVVECSASNLFWQIKGQWYTPKLDLCGVDGVMKHYIIDHLPGFSATKQVKNTVDALIEADSLFICNSLMGMVPVRRLTIADNDYHFDTQALSKMGDSLQEMLNAH